jgi:plasmid stabilization system protein ParE
MSRVLWMPSALEDLKSIREYIAKDSVYYADRFVDGAFERADQLEAFPKSGRIVPELGYPSVREIVYGSYRIIYELIHEFDDINVFVVAVIHGMRLLPSMYPADNDES